MPAFERPEQSRRQSCRKVLDPPSPLVISRQLVDQPDPARGPDGLGAQHAASKLFRPEIGHVADADIERRLRHLRPCDRPRGFFAVSLGPTRPEPVRQIQARRVLPLFDAYQLVRQPAQHRIHQTLRIFRPPAGKLDGLADRGMNRRFQKHQLGSAQTQDVANFRIRRLLHVAIDRLVDLSSPSQHRDHQEPGEGSIPRFQQLELGVPRERLVERSLIAEDAAQHVQRQSPRSRYDDRFVVYGFFFLGRSIVGLSRHAQAMILHLRPPADRAFRP